MRRYPIVLALILLAAAEAPTPAAPAPAQPIPAGSLLQKSFRMEVSILHAPLPQTPPKAALARLLRKTEPLQLVDSLPADTPAVPVVFLDSHPSAAPWPMDEGELAQFGRGLSDTDKQGHRGCKAITVLTFAGPGRAALSTYQRSLVLIAELAKETGGIVWDSETRELFSQAAWRKRSQDLTPNGLPSVMSQIKVDSYRKGQRRRRVTLGMRKFALPDVAINEGVVSYIGMNRVIELVSQRFIEGSFPSAPGRFPVAIDDVIHPGARKALASARGPGAKGRTELNLAIGKSERGDPENSLVEIVFPGADQTPLERQGEMLRQLFGDLDRTGTLVHDEELAAASARAKQTVLQYKPRYAEARPLSGERLAVMVPFEMSSGRHEYMWVEVLRWEGSSIHGVLANQPRDVPMLKAGARVNIQEDAIFDYMLQKPDGSTEGNLTASIIQRQQN